MAVVEPTAEQIAPAPIPTESLDFSVDGEVALTLPADTTSPKLARRFVRQAWPNLGEENLEDVELIVTELVSNAVRHGAPEIVLRLRRAPFGVDIGVLDHGPTLPPRSASAAAPDADRGRGLYLVEHMASSWRVEPLGTGDPGKTVWATIGTTDDVADAG